MSVQTVIIIDGLRYFVPSNLTSKAQKLVNERKLKQVNKKTLKPDDSFIAFNGRYYLIECDETDADDYHMLIIRALGADKAYRSILIDSFAAVPSCTVELLKEFFGHIPTLGELASTNSDSIKGVGKKKWQQIENILNQFLD